MRRSTVATALLATPEILEGGRAVPLLQNKLSPADAPQARGYKLRPLVRLALSLAVVLMTFTPLTLTYAQAPAPPSTVEETPSAMVRPHVVTKLPLNVKLSITAAILVVGLAVFAFSLRRWHLWNLFDRQYRFPKLESFAARLGGKKSGGRMATLAFDEPSPDVDSQPLSS